MLIKALTLNHSSESEVRVPIGNNYLSSQHSGGGGWRTASLRPTQETLPPKSKSWKCRLTIECLSNMHTPWVPTQHHKKKMCVSVSEKETESRNWRGGWSYAVLNTLRCLWGYKRNEIEENGFNLLSVFPFKYQSLGTGVLVFTDNSRGTWAVSTQGCSFRGRNT